MINYWWVTRPKRRLNSIPEVLSSFSEIALNEEWRGQRNTHLSFEDGLERYGLKRIGERRDHTGGGARTYAAWLMSLGLIFEQQDTKQVRLTLAGEAILEGQSPVRILTDQILKYQFPSAYSLSRNVNVSPRFRIHPFRFLLKLLADQRINELTEEEIAKVIIVRASNESNKCYEDVVNEILAFRESKGHNIPVDFFDRYAPSKGKINPTKSFQYLLDIANTIVNWLEYTQLVKRGDRSSVRILFDKQDQVKSILEQPLPFIDRPEDREYFQRKYGLDPNHRKDTRSFLMSSAITADMLDEAKIKREFLTQAVKQPISRITDDIIGCISEKTGIERSRTEEFLYRLYPHGAVGAFMTEYFEMAFRGRDEASEFEKATVALFHDIMEFQTEHVGPLGLTPDVLIISQDERFCGIIDNKAYAAYTVSNDHRNRMIHNYIEGLDNYYSGNFPMAFFSYIAGDFGKNISQQISSISEESGICGSTLTVSDIIYLAEHYREDRYTHRDIKRIFSVNRKVTLKDLQFDGKSR